MAKHILAGSLIIVLFTQFVCADQFLNRKTGESFYGYPTNRTRKNTTQVYVQQEDKYIRKSIDLAEYEVTYKAKGRKNNVVILPIQKPDVIMSKAVSDLLADTIIRSANKGPRYILLEIDCPGGRGEFMKEIAAAVSKTDNCPVIAFIPGGATGGAFSAAAAVAMACDAVFIAPDAVMGTVAPPVSISAGGEDPKDTYTSASLASYGTYMAALAEKAGRNGDLAAALIDTSMEIIEITADKAGKRKFIDKTEKRPSDAIIRVWSKPIKKTGTNPVYSQNALIAVNTFEYKLTMNSQEAVHARMADKIANSREEVLAFLGASDAKKQPTNRIDREIRSYVKNKRVMVDLFANIELLDVRKTELETSLEELYDEARSSKSAAAEQSRLRRLENEEYERRTNRNQLVPTRKAHVFKSNRNRPRRNNVKSSPRRQREMQNAATEVDPYVIRENMILTELSRVLNGLLTDYSRVIKIGKKYPGTLPAGKNYRAVQVQYDEVVSRLNNGYF